MEKRILPPPEDWRFQIVEVVPGLLLSNKLVEPHDYASLSVDAIVALDDWEYTWSPAVPENAVYLHFPIGDEAFVDPKTRHVARFVADLVQGGSRTLVHCLQGLNRSALVVARALMFLGMSADDAIGLVRKRRGLDEGFGALGNEDFVRWLRSEAGRA